jgi:MFS family permease
MPDDTAVTPRRFDVQLAVALSLIVQTAASLLAACVPVLAPDVAATRGWDVTLVAFYPTVLYATAFFVSFKVPQLLKRLGGMGLSVTCLAVTAVGLLCLLSPRLALIAGAPLAAGFASASMNPASSQVLGPRTTSANAAFVMSIKQTGVPLGGVLAGLLIPVLVARFTWPNAVLVLFVASMAMAVMLLPSVRWLDRAASSAWPAAYRPLEPVKHLVALPNMLPILVASFVFTGMQLCLRTFFTVYLVKNQGLSLVSAGLAFSVSQAAGIVGQVGWAALSDRLLTARQVMVVIGIVMSVAAVLTATMTANWPIYAVVAIAAAVGVSAAAFVPVVLGEVARQSPPGYVGALTSGVQLFLLAGALIGPLLFGAIASQFGFANAFMAAAGCTFVGAAMLAIPARAWRGARGA